MLRLKYPIIGPIIFFLLGFMAIGSGLVHHLIYNDIQNYRPWTLIETVQAYPLIELRDILLSAVMLSLVMTAIGMYYLSGVFVDVAGTNSYGSARFAELRDLKKVGLLETYGVVVGRLKGKLLQTSRPDYSNVLLAAPPGAGKGVGVIIPTLLTYPGSVIVYDVKGENYEATARHRAAAGDKILVFSPWDLTTENGRYRGAGSEAKILIENWRKHYNTIRPHSSLGHRPPAPETKTHFKISTQNATQKAAAL